MGGTFDPPHYAHLEIAARALEELCLDRVIFLPNGQPPHKPSYEVSAAEHRYVMTQLACADHPRFFVSRAEIERPGPSYTIETLRSLHALLGPATELFLLVGFDSALELPTWREPDAVLAAATLVAAPRPGSDPAALETALGAERAAQVRRLEMPLLEISSTALRARAECGRSLTYLLPPSVEAYINKYSLYHKG
jgi:nicotinate-nucleotide adenylyltransferase